MVYRLIVANSKYLYIWPSRWTLWPIVLSKEEIEQAFNNPVNTGEENEEERKD